MKTEQLSWHHFFYSSQSDSLLQRSNGTGTQLDGAVRSHFWRNASPFPPTTHLFKTSWPAPLLLLPPFYLAPLCHHLSSSPPTLFIIPISSSSPPSCAPLPPPQSHFSAPLFHPSLSTAALPLPPSLRIPITTSSLVLYGAALVCVSPPEVSSCIRLPEAGRLTPVAQLKNILWRKKKPREIRSV